MYQAVRFIAVSAFILLCAACGGGGGGDSAPPAQSASNNAGNSITTDLDTLRSATAQLTAPAAIVDDDTRQRMQAMQSPPPSGRSGLIWAPPAETPVDDYFIHYGDLTPEVVATAKRHQLAILHPQWLSMTREVIADIQQGLDPLDPSDDVKVLLYVSIGEDQRTAPYTDAQMLADPRFTGDGSGPRVDPRGQFPNGGSDLSQVSQLGAPSPGGTGFASFYLDDNDWINGDADGLPDRNSHFGAAFVNAGDPLWFEVVDHMTLDGPDGLSGLKEALTLDFGRGLGADGVFLDTIDTAAPNFYTDASSPNQSEYEWTAPGFADFIRRLRAAYPDKTVLQNRGLFFFDPRLPHFSYHAGDAIDYVLFESYRLNSNSFESFNPLLYADNKYNFAPKLMAEAGRSNGFRVLGLGYPEGPDVTPQTLTGHTTQGLDTLLADIDETQNKAGFRHYIANAAIDHANEFVKTQAQLTDTEPPRWTSTFNDNAAPWPDESTEATPRVGLLGAVSEQAALRLHWDVALDLNPVRYILYIQDTPFDFADNEPLAQARRIVLPPATRADYGKTPLENTSANEAVVDGLDSNTTYHLLLRAQDAAGNEESNEVVVSATTLPQRIIDGDFAEWTNEDPLLTDDDDVVDSAGPDFLEVKTSRTDTALHLYFSSANAFALDGSPASSYSRTLVFIDEDNDSATGYPVAGTLGSEWVLNGEHLYRQSSDQFNAGFVATVDAAQSSDGTQTEISLPLDLFASSTIRIVFVNDDAGDYAPNYGEALTLRLNDDPTAAAWTVDGDFSEWAGVEPVLTDAADAPDSGGPDWLDIQLHCTADNLHIAFRSDDAFRLDGSPDANFSRTLIFFDTDETAQTGFTIGGIGSDLVLNGTGMYRQTSDSFNDGFLNSIDAMASGDDRRVELAIPWASVGNNWMRILFVNDETFDLAPNLGEVVRLHPESCAAAVVPNTLPPPFVMDGQFTDWQHVPTFLFDADDAPQSAGPNWQEIKIANDEATLFLSADAYDEYNLDGSPAYAFSRFLIFIDADNNPDTGYAIRGLGSDVVINGPHAYQQTRTNFASEYLGRLEVGEAERRVEMAMPRSWLTGAASVRILFANDETFDFAPNAESPALYTFTP